MKIIPLSFKYFSYFSRLTAVIACSIPGSERVGKRAKRKRKTRAKKGAGTGERRRATKPAVVPGATQDLGLATKGYKTDRQQPGPIVNVRSLREGEQPRPQGLLAFQNGGSLGEDPGNPLAHSRSRVSNEDGDVFKMAATAKRV